MSPMQPDLTSLPATMTLTGPGTAALPQVPGQAAASEGLDFAGLLGAALPPLPESSVPATPLPGGGPLAEAVSAPSTPEEAPRLPTGTILPLAGASLPVAAEGPVSAVVAPVAAPQPAVPPSAEPRAVAAPVAVPSAAPIPVASVPAELAETSEPDTGAAAEPDGSEAVAEDGDEDAAADTPAPPAPPMLATPIVIAAPAPAPVAEPAPAVRAAAVVSVAAAVPSVSPRSAARAAAPAAAAAAKAAPATTAPAAGPAPLTPPVAAREDEAAPDLRAAPAASPAASLAPLLAEPAPTATPTLAAAPVAPSAPQPERAEPRSLAPQLESTIAQVGDLREALRSARPAMTLNHADFGMISLRLEAAAPDQWRAVLASRDPGFVPAIQAALAERAVAAADPGSPAGFMGQQHGAAGQNGGQNGTADHRYGASPNGGQGGSQPYLGQSGSRDGEAAPDHRRPSTAATLAARAEEEVTGSSPAPPTHGVFA
jgi:hypothetical protein